MIEGPFDAVCVSEGEEAIVELADALERGETPRGIQNFWIRHGAEVERNEARPFPAGIDDLPYPSRAMWEPYVEFPQKNDPV